jgi:hypothetical protein
MFNLNRLAVLVTLVILALIAALSGYRLELGTGGLKFEGARPSITAQTAAHES